MLALSFSAGMLGIEGYVVRVEADSSAGSPAFTIIGLPDRALAEARDRVRAAIFNSGFAYPAGRLLVNLSPADVQPCTPNVLVIRFEGRRIGPVVTSWIVGVLNRAVPRFERG